MVNITGRGLESEKFAINAGGASRMTAESLRFIIVLEVSSIVFKTGLLWELLYAHDFV